MDGSDCHGKVTHHLPGIALLDCFKGCETAVDAVLNAADLLSIHWEGGSPLS